MQMYEFVKNLANKNLLFSLSSLIFYFGILFLSLYGLGSILFVGVKKIVRAYCIV